MAAEDRDPPGFPQHFRVLLKREHGMWKYESCTLEVALFVDSNEVSFVCHPTKGRSLRVAAQMSPIQAELLRDLVEASHLFGPDHAGVDATPGDGIFETLRFQSAEAGPAAVVVTSGNESFVNQQPRRELRRLLAEIEADLRRKGGMNE
jgi:hypothetical protein